MVLCAARDGTLSQPSSYKVPTVSFTDRTFRFKVDQLTGACCGFGRLEKQISPLTGLPTGNGIELRQTRKKSGGIDLVRDRSVIASIYTDPLSNPFHSTMSRWRGLSISAAGILLLPMRVNRLADTSHLRMSCAYWYSSSKAGADIQPFQPTAESRQRPISYLTTNKPTCWRASGREEATRQACGGSQNRAVCIRHRPPVIDRRPFPFTVIYQAYSQGS
jgi:hypothetical protein